MNYLVFFTLKDLLLSGNPNSLIFNKYDLNLTFSVLFKSEAIIQIETISIADYNDRAIWNHTYSFGAKEGDNSIIFINNSFQRRVESNYFFIIPSIAGFVLLGGSHLLPSTKVIKGRLTIYLTIFVFMLVLLVSVKLCKI